MSLDLTIYPIRHSQYFLEGNYPVLATEKLTFHGEEKLFKKFLPFLKPLPPLTKLEVYSEEGSIITDKDAYDNRLSYAFSGEIQLLKSDSDSQWNQAILAFLLALPPNIPIIFYWR